MTQAIIRPSSIALSIALSSRTMSADLDSRRVTLQSGNVGGRRLLTDAAPTAKWKTWLRFVAVLVLAGAFHAKYLIARHYLGDESLYVNAASLVQSGQSAFLAPAYLGTAFFAHIFARMAGMFGIFPVAVAFRLLNLLAVATIAWLAAIESKCSTNIRLVIAAALALAAPPLAEGLRVGNLSILVAALTLLALRYWGERPVCAGLLLGAGLVVKPYALGFLPVLLVARLRPRSRANLVFACVAGAIFAIGLCALPAELVAMAHSHEAMDVELRSLSLQRIAFCFTGWGPRTSVILLVVLGSAALYTARTTRTLREVGHIAVLASLLSITRIWLHVLAVTLPWAVVVVADRVRGLHAVWRESLRARRIATLRLLLSVALALVLYNCDAFFALSILVPAIPPLLDGVGTLIPFSALVIVFWQSLALDDGPV
jgi:hypothetical protein